MAVTYDDVLKLDLRGEFTGIDVTVLQCIIDDEATPQVGDAWGDCQELAITYLAAHITAKRLKGSSAPAGPVVGQSSGGLSRTYGNPSGGAISEQELSSTTYGQDYLRLSRKVCTTPLVAYV